MEGVCQRLGAEDLARVRGVGITNQRETTILWDRTTGRCLHNAIVWCDGRTGGVVSKLVSSVGKDGLRVSGREGGRDGWREGGMSHEEVKSKERL